MRRGHWREAQQVAARPVGNDGGLSLSGVTRHRDEWTEGSLGIGFSVEALMCVWCEGEGGVKDAAHVLAWMVGGGDA